MKNELLISAALCVAATTASAQLVITEVMSNSSHPGGPANGDWWELTNTGGSSVDLMNYYWDDSGPNGDDGALFPSITIAAGESIVIVDENSDNIAGFVAAWGGGFTAYSKDDFSGNNTFSGLSAGGDQIQLWDADPNVGSANLVAEVVFGESTDGHSFVWGTNGDYLGISQNNVGGAFVAPGNGAGGAGTDVGSPGFAAVPEPEFFGALAGLMVFGFAALRRRRK
ncbi:lamin tail domain-containing protein [Puniceicoccus vermicola]|uniref:Lamin tail domain-containing protein n=1 Tax=Puniceicoccus vermicola TaxID=388746 RepID=A0A7X1E5Q1_9BACT|nr:lamin tail domain-containing protein [Puniceicoccus vermicola]MBC2603396.1 lamin tail domain-containing protein [Puniceicoccus vermicola]